ncbi:MAG: histidine phosphatase family protein [Tetrasphaera sp.]
MTRPDRTVWFLTHPQVAVDPDTPVPQWELSAVGRGRAAALAGAPFLERVDSVWSSAEVKAVRTAELLAGDLPRFVRDDLGENDRSATGFVPPEEFEGLADAFFARPQESVRGWATAADEQHRIVAAVEAVLADPRAGERDLVIVAHGGVGTLLLCHLLGEPITRRRDQPGQGHYFALDRDTRAVRHTWRPLEDLR